jgi:tetratricopeptide (TPR) repeat protein
VGRDDVLAAGGAWIEGVASGAGHAALVVGEAGIGKSRALSELADLAAQADFRVHTGRCLEAEGAPAYWPWVQVLRSVWEALPDGDREEWRVRYRPAWNLVPELSEAPAGSPSDEGASARFHRFDAVSRLLNEASDEGPIALVLDDLHRMDRSSALLLEHVLKALPGTPILVLGGLRDRELPADHPFEAMLRELHDAGRRLDLRGLAPAEVRELIATLTGRAPSSAIAEAIATRTGGNPLFVSEIARALARDGVVDDPRAVERAAPQTVRQIVRARVSRLEAPAPRVLEVAAVFGREFPLDAVCAACEELAPAEVEAGLEAALRDHLVEETSDAPGDFRFTHIVIRDAIYEELPRPQRTELHRRAGLALEALRPLALDAHADELAHHFACAAVRGEAGRAVRYARRAGDIALENAAHGEAAARFEAALRALDVRLGRDHEDRELTAASLERGELLVRLGRSRWLGGWTGEARDAFREAARLAREYGSGELLARAGIGIAGRTDATPGVNLEAVAMLEEALALLPDADHALRAETLARLGTELYYDERWEQGQALAAEAVAMAERIGDGALLSYVLSARHYTLMRADVDPSERRDLTERMIALADATGARESMAIGLQESIVDLLELGDIARLDYLLHRFEALSERMRQPFFGWMCTGYRVMRAFLAGDVERAETLAHRALEEGQEFGTPNALPAFAGQIYCIRREQGRLAELESLIRAAVEQQPVFHPLRAGLIALYAAGGRRGEALDELDRMMEHGLDDIPRDTHWISVLTTLTRACAGLGDAVRAARVYELLRPYSGRIVCIGHGTGTDGAVDHHLGRLAATMKEPAAADAHFEAAVALHRRVGAPLLAAHTRREWAGLLWREGAPHERERARELAREAIATYERLGFGHRVEATRAALEDA